MFGDDLTAAELPAKIQTVINATSDAVTGDSKTIFNRYTKQGSAHHSYTDVGRLWVLNEDKAFAGATYGRSNGETTKWQSANYEGFDFHADYCFCPKTREDKAWIPRPRKMLPLLSRRETDSAELPPLIEASWDDGITWYTYRSCRILEDRIGIYLTAGNLVTDTEPGDDNRSTHEAIIRGTFRLRATFSVESDDRIFGESSEVDSWATGKRHRNIHRIEDFRGEFQTESSLLQVAGTPVSGWTFTELDQSDQAEALANRVVASARHRLISGLAVIPWLTDRWRPGDLCKGVEPGGPMFVAAGGDDPRYIELAGVRWTNTAGQSTQLTITDSRRAIRKV
jgi:hypothetical protein